MCYIYVNNIIYKLSIVLFLIVNMQNDSSNKTDDKSIINFEQALTELDTIVNKLETGNLSLEQALHNFELGVKLTKQCQTTLDQAEQKVKILTTQDIETHN